MSNGAPSRLNLADEIKGPWRHAIITTFGVDLGFFERAILPLISQARARLVLADHAHLLAHQSAAVRDGIVRHWNHSYLVSGVRHRHATHTKLILLTSSDRGRLLVGSGNLGVRGWTSVGELFTRYDYGPDQSTELAAFQAARDYLDLLASWEVVDRFTAAYLHEIWQGTPWLAVADSRETPVRHNLRESFIDQLESTIADQGLGPIQRLVVMAPFHDPNANTIETLIERLKPAATSIVLQRGNTSADPQALARLAESNRSISFLEVSAHGHQGTYLHAKLVLVDDGKTAVCLQGSPNLSAVALLTSGADANLEMANLLIGQVGDFDHIISALDTSPVDDPSLLEIQVHGFGTPDPGGIEALRLLAARWDGESFHLDVQTDLRWAPADLLRIRVRNDVVSTRIISVDEAADGYVTLIVSPEGEIDDLLSSAAPVALIDPTADLDSDAEGGLSNPVFCVHQPSLRHLLDARPTHSRMREIGTLGLADDDELGELLEALQGTMVIDSATLVAAVPPTTKPADAEDDEAVFIAYAEVDYERLRNDPALRQYLYAGPTEHAARHQQGLEPLGIQMALRSITDAFRSAVGLTGDAHAARRFESDWSTVEDDDIAEEELRDESELDQDDEHVDSDRRWSDEARTRRIWHNFINRYLMGIKNRRWQELAGPWVLAGNYDLFAHILQRLHRQPWRDVGYLLQAQAKTHGFVWGGAPIEDRNEGKGGWLRSLPQEDHRVSLDGLVERHVPARLLCDLVIAALLTDPHTDAGLPERERIDLRIAWRDLAQAVLTHTDWMETLARTPELSGHAVQLAVALAAPDPELDLGGLASLTSPAALQALTQLTSCSTRQELHEELAGVLGVEPHDIVISDETLGPVGRQKIAHQLTLPADLHLSASGAAKALSVWRVRERATVYRIRAGRSFVEYQDGRSAQWRKTLYDDPFLLEIPDLDPPPWADSLDALRAEWELERHVA